ncbi:hypothetical protein OH77DRAFT_1420298 [Trametes cingulata]|nr:hypothetical protein OH77DRAFT_1420298 [Trametes cingulata]
MATTGPAAFPSSVHMPRTSRHRVPAAHAHEAGAGEPRVRSILLSGRSTSTSSTSAHGARNGDQHGAPDRTSAAASPARSRRTTRRTGSGEIAGEGDGALAAGRVQIGSSSDVVQPESDSGEARPSSSASASKHLEEDLAAALASTPTPERTTSLDASSPTITMPAPRPRMSLELPAPDAPLDILYDADHKLALEGTSPKPCIVPGNALHLIDDDPAAPRSQTPPSVIIIAGENGDIHEAESCADEEVTTPEGGRTSSQPPTRPTGPRVRFRSRVRITSGLHRHRHSTTGGTPTPCSSASDSPSSSISAPLRYQADENGAWGPLGKRLSAYAAAGGWQRRTQVSQQQRVQVSQPTETRPGGRIRHGGKGGRSYNERTPLLRPGRQRPYTEEEEDEDADRRDDQLSAEERSMRAAALRREEEAVFGKWPWRIFNRHWWWWHVEPVLCCCCSDDSDYEEF